MSYEAETTMAHDRADRGSADSVAGFMASFAIFLSFIGIIIGLIMIIGGIMALWMTYRRRKYPSSA